MADPNPQSPARSPQDAPLSYAEPGTRSHRVSHRPVELEIHLGTGRRLLGYFAYLLFFLAVSGTLVWLFYHFTASIRFAAGIVLFMVAYMLFMGWMAGRKPEDRDV